MKAVCSPIVIQYLEQAINFVFRSIVREHHRNPSTLRQFGLELVEEFPWFFRGYQHLPIVVLASSAHDNPFHTALRDAVGTRLMAQHLHQLVDGALPANVGKDESGH